MTRRRAVRRAPLVGSIVLALAAAPAASADLTKTACIDANTKGQDLRRDAKLTAALEQFLACASASCPAILRDDCTRRVDEVERALPTIVFDAKDSSDQDVSTVQVTVDGKFATDRLTGAPLTVDPGEHVFVFQVAGQAPVTRTLVMREGERDRRERIVVMTSSPSPSPAPSGPPPAIAPGAGVSPIVAPPAAATPAPEVTPAPPVPVSPSVAPASTSPNAGGISTREILALTAAGVGGVGLAIGAVFGLMTFSKASDQKTDCAATANCDNRAQALADHSSATTDGTIATVAFVAGGALLGTGAFLFFAPHHDAAPSGTALVVTPSIGPGRAGAWLTGRF